MLVNDDLHLRVARLDDVPAISALIEQSVRQLWTSDYTPRQIESAVRYVADVDTRVIGDGTYFVVEHDNRIIAGGGWSRRATLYGGDGHHGRSDERLDPATDAARVRGFFVHPDFARRGIGRRLLNVCEYAAAAAGFSRLELASTLAGRHLYLACGFTRIETIVDTLPDGVVISGWRMTKPISLYPTELELTEVTR